MGPQTDTTTPGQNGPESNGNEGVLYVPQTWNVSVRCNLMS